MLRAKLFALQEEERLEKIATTRKMQVGTGSRSEKIRTYNYKDSRRARTAARYARRRASPAHAPPAPRATRSHRRACARHTHTLRFPVSRCTDHRLGSNFALDGVLSGQIEPIVGACIAMDQQEQLEEMQAE